MLELIYPIHSQQQSIQGIPIQFLGEVGTYAEPSTTISIPVCGRDASCMSPVSSQAYLWSKIHILGKGPIQSVYTNRQQGASSAGPARYPMAQIPAFHPSIRSSMKQSKASRSGLWLSSCTRMATGHISKLRMVETSTRNPNRT